MEQLYDYKMVENRFVVEQAHEFQSLAKELDLFLCPLPEKFVAGSIIAKVPPFWKDFATSMSFFHPCIKLLMKLFCQTIFSKQLT